MSRYEQWNSARNLYLNTVKKVRLEANDKTDYSIDDAAIEVCLKQLDRLDVRFTIAKAAGKDQLYAARSELAANFKTEVGKLDPLATRFVTEAGKQIVLWKALRTKDKSADLDEAKLSAIANNWVRGLKVLKTSIDAILKSAEARVAGMDSTLRGMKTELNAIETMGREYLAVLKAAVARALAAAQRMKASPTKADYDKEFPKAARDITQQLGNVKKIEEAAGAAPGGVTGAQAKRLFDELVPWASGNLQKIDPKRSEKEILAQVSAFNKAVKAVKDAYGI